MRLRELVNCDLSSCRMFFMICRRSMADEDAHRRSYRRPMTSIINGFLNGRKDPKAVNAGPQNACTYNFGKCWRIHSGRTGAHKVFLKLTTQRPEAEDPYSNPESLPSFKVAYQNFKQAYPRFKETSAMDVLREHEYGHFREEEHVCFDYNGFGLFSRWQQVYHRESSSFSLAYISANLPTHALYGTADEGTIEFYIRKRIMNYMNLSDVDYSMVFTASRGTAYKLLAESYPFDMNKRLLTVYDYESDAVSWMAGIAKDKGAEIVNASFMWPNLKIAAPDLIYKLQDKKKKKDQTAKGLFVFPVQSRVTGAKYSYQWMSQAQANNWHVLLDASALAPKDMDSLALALFRPEFIVTSFYRVFGADPTGFGCLLIKNSTIEGLHNSDRARGVGMVRMISSGVSNSTLWRGPMAQFCMDSVRDKAVPERNTFKGREMDFGGFDNSLLTLHNEEEWDDRLHGEIHSGRSHARHEDFVFQAANSSGTEFGRGEIEEPSEAIFPLNRRGPTSGGLCAGASNEGEGHPSPDEEFFFFKGVTGPNVEVVDVNDRVLGMLDESSSSRGNSNRFLKRRQEEETDDCDDVSPPLGEDSPQGLCKSIGGIGSLTTGCTLFHSSSGSHDAFEELGHYSPVHQKQESNLLENTAKGANEVGERSEDDKLESIIMFRDDRDFALREGRDLISSFEEDRVLRADPEGLNGGHSWGFDCANERHLQLHSAGEGTSQWEAQCAMSDEGSSMYLDDYNGNMRPSNDAMLVEGPVVCSGLDHADSQGLNKTNLRLRFLIDWLINALLKLRHPAQIDTQGKNLVHIYGPEGRFDRGHSMAFNLFDWNGVLVRAELVQRLADRNNISLGLGTLCSIVYPEGSTDLAGLCFNISLGGGNTEADPSRASNARKHDHPSQIPVVTAALGFVSNFEDVYRLWTFVAKFLDADFVKREELLYHSLNQEIHVL